MQKAPLGSRADMPRGRGANCSDILHECCESARGHVGAEARPFDNRDLGSRFCAMHRRRKTFDEPPSIDRRCTEIRCAKKISNECWVNEETEEPKLSAAAVIPSSTENRFSRGTAFETFFELCTWLHMALMPIRANSWCSVTRAFQTSN